MPNLEDYTRVTEILSLFMKLDQIDPAVLKNKQEIGDEVHDSIDAFIGGLGEFERQPRCEGYYKSFKEWVPMKEFLPQPDRWFCDEWMITGKCDQICKTCEGLVLVDFKTSHSPSKSWPLQGAAYCYLAKKSGYEIKSVEFIKLDKTGEYPKVFEYTEDQMKESLEVFLKALEVYRFFNPRKKLRR